MITEAWAFLAICIIYIVILFIVLKYARRRQITLTAFHPYYCGKCKYDMLGSIAFGKNVCPECNYAQSFTHEDAVIAKALLTTGRIPSSYETYHLYEPVARDNRIAWHYARSIFADSQRSADAVAKGLYGEQAAAFKAKLYSYDENHNQTAFIPPVLITSVRENGLVTLDADGRALFSDSSDLQPSIRAPLQGTD